MLHSPPVDSDAWEVVGYLDDDALDVLAELLVTLSDAAEDKQEQGSEGEARA
ncbi:MAG: hypothetical protein ACKVP0_05640 [Pirellulaceae bacterium]